MCVNHWSGMMAFHAINNGAGPYRGRVLNKTLITLAVGG